MKILFSIVVTFLSLTSFSQNMPDWELIEHEVTNPSSRYYYPRMMERYQRNDTTLTLREYYHLYYGYPTQAEYKPLLMTNYTDSLNMVFGNRRITRGDEFSKIERYCKAILQVEPFNMRDLNVLAYAYFNVGYDDKAKEQIFKIKMISEVIRSTGDGLTDKYPWYIIYSDHADDLLNLVEAEPGRHIFISSDVEFVSCKKTPDKKIKGYYFNIAEIQKRTDYLQGVDKPKRKMDINPVPTKIN